MKTGCGDKHGNRMYRVPNPDSEARKNPSRCSSDARKIPERSLKNTKSPPEASSLQLRFPATCLGQPHNKVVSQPPGSKSPPSGRPNSPHLSGNHPHLTENTRNNKRPPRIVFSLVSSFISQEVISQWETQSQPTLFPKDKIR